MLCGVRAFLPNGHSTPSSKFSHSGNLKMPDSTNLPSIGEREIFSERRALSADMADGEGGGGTLLVAADGIWPRRCGAIDIC